MFSPFSRCWLVCLIVGSAAVGCGSESSPLPAEDGSSSDTSALDAEIPDEGDFDTSDSNIPSDSQQPDHDSAVFDGLDSFIELTGSDTQPDQPPSTDPDITEHDIDPDAPIPDAWCRTQWPMSSVTVAGYLTETMYARVWVEGVTPSPNDASAPSVSLGWGPVTTSPLEDEWTWIDGTLNLLCGGCEDEDELMGRFQIDVAGDYLWAAALSLGGTHVLCDRGDGDRLGSVDGWRAADAPELEVVTNGSLTIVTLNLRCLIDDWNARLGIVAAELAELDPDLMGFQEVCAEPSGGDNLTELVAALEDLTGRTYSIHRAVTHWSWDTYDEGIGIVTPHRLGETHDVTLPAGVFSRKLVLARVMTPVGPVIFSTTHLDHQSTETRSAQIAAAVDALENFSVDNELQILTGDLNEGPGGSVTTHLSEAGFTDAWVETNGTAPGHTFPAGSAHSRIDYVMINSGTAPFVSDAAQVAFNEAVDGTFGSDHLGVFVDVFAGDR